MSGADDVEHVLLGLADETVRVGIGEGKTWTRSPVAEEAELDVLCADLAVQEGVLLEEDHS